MSEMENQEFYATLVAKGKRDGHLSLEEVRRILPQDLRDDEHYLEELLNSLESQHGILVSEEDMENDLLKHIEEEQAARKREGIEHEDEHEIDDEPLIEDELDEDEEEIEEDLEDAMMDGDLTDISGISSSRHSVDDLDDEKLIDDHDEELDDEEIEEEEDLDDDEDEDDSDEEELGKAYSKADMGSFDEIGGYEGGRRKSIRDIEDDGERDSNRESGRRSNILGSDKSDSSVDDPIRLYLREIGRENLLNA